MFLFGDIFNFKLVLRCCKGPWFPTSFQQKNLKFLSGILNCVWNNYKNWYVQILVFYGVFFKFCKICSFCSKQNSQKITFSVIFWWKSSTDWCSFLMNFGIHDVRCVFNITQFSKKNKSSSSSEIAVFFPPRYPILLAHTKNRPNLACFFRFRG